MSNLYTFQDGCTVCSSTDVTPLIEITRVPVHCNLLWPHREQALQAPRGDIKLGFCHDCGHVFNVAFDPELMAYSQAYENSLHFSPCFQSYAESLAARLIDRYELHNKDIIEIGCGKGEFLTLLCELGGNRGVGFDPSYVPDLNANASTERITFIQDFYSERYAGYKADLICCRHVLEHIPSPRDFLSTVRRSIGNRSHTVVFFEVPNVLFTLRDMGIWDLIYEHCSYFSSSSLSRLFLTCGFDVRDLTETYAGQFLGVEALPGAKPAHLANGPGEKLKEMMPHVAAFVKQYQNKVETWSRHLERMAQAGQRAVAWGAGSKGATFLNVLKTQNQIKYAIDINPRKQGMYVPGAGQQIVPPEFISEYMPDVVIVMNPLYKNEIQQLLEHLDLSPELMCV